MQTKRKYWKKRHTTCIKVREKVGWRKKSLKMHFNFSLFFEKMFILSLHPHLVVDRREENVALFICKFRVANKTSSRCTSDKSVRIFTGRTQALHIFLLILILLFIVLEGHMRSGHIHTKYVCAQECPGGEKFVSLARDNSDECDGGWDEWRASGDH